MLNLLWPPLIVIFGIPDLIWRGTAYFVQNNTTIILPGNTRRTTSQLPCRTLATHFWRQIRSVETVCKYRKCNFLTGLITSLTDLLQAYHQGRIGTSKTKSTGSPALAPIALLSEFFCFVLAGNLFAGYIELFASKENVASWQVQLPQWLICYRLITKGG